jgi:hypothetical protein
MKVFITSDWHLDAVTAGVERHEEVAQAAWHVANAAITHGGVFVFLGDLCNPSTARAHRADRTAVQIASTLKAQGIPSFWIVGNHDVIEDGRGTHTLAGVAGVMGDAVCSRPTLHGIEHDTELLCLPYPAATNNYDVQAEATRLIGESKVPKIIVLSHLDIRGAVPGSESGDMKRGRMVWLPHHEIRKAAELAGKRIHFFNGHYHARQTIDGVDIPGSAARLRFDEEHNVPTYLMFDTETWELEDRLIPDPATMRTWDVTDEAALAPKATFVRLQGERTQVQAAAQRLAATGTAVKVDAGPVDLFVGQRPKAAAGASARDIVTDAAKAAPPEIREGLLATVERIMGQAGL